MKVLSYLKKTSKSLNFLIAFILLISAAGFAIDNPIVKKVFTTGNPFIKHMFTADPSAHVFEGKMYVYPSHDRDNNKGFDMTDYHVFSSDDLLNWTDHGKVLDVADVPWASEYMWAPDCVFKNGTYYFYFPARNKAGEFRIGVATSKSPAGPFIPEAEPIKGSFSVDPAVFIDTDGQAYMYFGGDGMGGQKTPWVAKMDETMKEFKEAPMALTGIDYWFEACWMNKIGDTYFLSYSTGGKHPLRKGSSLIGYATSKSPMGPFVYQGLLNDRVTGWTNHHSIVEWKGQTYFFYHNSDMSGGKTAQRCLAADYIHYTADGKIHEIFQTANGLGRYDGNEKIEAENYSETNGVLKNGNRENGFHISLKNKDFFVFKNIDLTKNNPSQIELRIASANKKGLLEIREKGKAGKVIAKVKLENSKGIDAWETLTAKIPTLQGNKDLVFTYKGKKGDRLLIDWILFKE